MTIVIAGLICVLAAASGASPSPAPQGWQDRGRPYALTDAGPVTGIKRTVLDAKYDLNVYLGVPFAAPPERWSPPVPPTPWTEPYNASIISPACIQQFNYPEARRNLILQWFNNPAAPESEDCLYLNVYAPKTKKPSAVMVWIYGGGNLYGSNFNPLYHGENLAANEDVVTVILNYRTNVFGFPGADELELTERNLGFLDQRLGLDWVRRNIAAFGGDPKRVTVFGESAGALAVDALLTAPPTPLPFQSAIMQSGTHTYRGRPTDPSASFRLLTAAMSCNTSTNPHSILTCLRSLPATTLRDYNERARLPWAPVFDNVTSASTARSNRLSGDGSRFARVPVLSGTNAHEGRLYSFSATNSTAFILSLFPLFNSSQVQNLLSQYPLDTGEFTNDFQRLAAVYTDFVFQCPCALVHEESGRVGVPSWRYYYNSSFAGSQLFEDAGVYHASEIGVVWGTYESDGATEFQGELSRGLGRLWAGFARDPWGFDKDGKGWGMGEGRLGVLGGGVRAEDGPEASGSVLEEVGGDVVAQVDRRCALYQPIYDVLGR